MVPMKVQMTWFANQFFPHDFVPRFYLSHLLYLILFLLVLFLLSKFAFLAASSVHYPHCRCRYTPFLLSF